MANRVYIFVSNEIPKHGGTVERMKGLYENNYSPGLAGLLMCGHNYIKQGYSPLWENSTCSISKFDMDFINSYLDLFLKVINSEAGKKAQYKLKDLSKVTERDITKAKNIVKKQKGQFIITDFSEVSSMDEDQIEKIIELNVWYAKQSIKETLKYKNIMKGGLFSKDPVVNFVKFIDKVERSLTIQSGIFGFSERLYYS